MKKTFLLVALMLSLGINIGLFLPRLVQPDVPAAGGEEEQQPQMSPPVRTDAQVEDSPEESSRAAADVAVTPRPADEAPSSDAGATTLAPTATADGAAAPAPPEGGQRRLQSPAERRQGGAIRARREVEMLANRLRLSGPKRRRFMRLQADMVRTTREMVPRLESLRRQLYSNVVSETPSREVIEANLEEMVRAQIGLEQRVIRTVIATRELLDDEQEAIYLRFLSRRLGPLRDALQAGQPGRPREP